MLSRLAFAPAYSIMACGFIRESMTSGWLFRRLLIGLTDWLSAPYRLLCVPNVVETIGRYGCSTSVVRPSRPALLIVLVFRVMPFGL